MKLLDVNVYKEFNKNPPYKKSLLNLLKKLKKIIKVYVDLVLQLKEM